MSTCLANFQNACYPDFAEPVLKYRYPNDTHLQMVIKEAMQQLHKAEWRRFTSGLLTYFSPLKKRELSGKTALAP